MNTNHHQFSSHHHMDDDDATASSLTLSLPSSSSSSPSPPSSSQVTLSLPSSSSSSSSSPPRPAPFEYTPLTPPTRLPIDSQTLFHSQILFPTTQQLSCEPSNDFYDHQEQQIQLSLWPPNIPTITHQPNLPPSPPPPVKDEQPPPFPWSTSKPATVHTFNHMVTVLNIKTVSGTLVCKFCKFQQNDVQFDLVEKFQRLRSFIMNEFHKMDHRAPEAWKNPELGTCERCRKEKAMQPLIEGDNRNINWLFLFLGEMIGCCKIEQLKYFCKYSDKHRTAAKDRLIFWTYLGLCNQLQPKGPFQL